MDKYADRPVFCILNVRAPRKLLIIVIASLRTRKGARRRVHEKGANFTSTFSLPISLYGAFFICRGPYLGVFFSCIFFAVNQKAHTAHAIFVRSVSIYAEPFA